MQPQNHPQPTLPFRLKRSLLESAQSFTCKKGNRLLSPGMPQSCLWYLRQGLVKSFSYDKEGAPTVSHLFQAPALIPSPAAFLQDLPGTETLEIVSDARLLPIPREQFFILLQNIPAPILLELLSPLNTKIQLLELPPYQRYQKFQQHFPAHAFSRKEIAGYLCIAENSITRFRRNQHR